MKNEIYRILTEIKSRYPDIRPPLFGLQPTIEISDLPHLAPTRHKEIRPASKPAGRWRKVEAAPSGGIQHSRVPKLLGNKDIRLGE